MKIEDWFKAVYTQEVINALIHGTNEDREEIRKAIAERIRKDWRVEE